MRPVIYLAGPMGTVNIAENVRKAIAEARWLVEIGVAPLTPHTSFFMNYDNKFPYETWMDVDLSILPRCDALYRLPGESPGATREVTAALLAKQPVLYDRDAVLAWKRQWDKRQQEAA